MFVFALRAVPLLGITTFQIAKIFFFKLTRFTLLLSSNDIQRAGAETISND